MANVIDAPFITLSQSPFLSIPPLCMRAFCSCECPFSQSVRHTENARELIQPRSSFQLITDKSLKINTQDPLLLGWITLRHILCCLIHPDWTQLSIAVICSIHTPYRLLSLPCLTSLLSYQCSMDNFLHKLFELTFMYASIIWRETTRAIHTPKLWIIWASTWTEYVALSYDAGAIEMKFRLKW